MTTETRRSRDIRPIPMALVAALAAGPLAVPASAQDEEPVAAAWPEGWEVRPDRGHEAEGAHGAAAAPEDLSFRTMAPGWHVTTGPSAILYDPSRSASGRYRAETTLHLFDPGERREAFGLFVGGGALQEAEQRYTYFLIRRDGRYLIKERRGSETNVLRSWTAHDAVVGWAEKPEEAVSVENTLAVEARAEDVVFLVNGEEVDRLRREGLALDGIVGLRVNHGLDLHVSGLEVRPSGSP